MKKKIHLTLAIFLPLQIITVKILARYPHYVETVYSLQIFPVLSRIERQLLGWIPFSVGDILYLLFGIAIIYWTYKRIRTRFKAPGEWIIRVFSVISILYFCFHLLWGMNYYRLPLHKSLGIKTDYSEEELIKLSGKLVEKSNAFQELLTANDSTAVKFEFTPQELQKLSVQSYGYVSVIFPNLNYKVKSIKPSLFSLPLTYMGFSGYLNPLTNEAQVNRLLPGFRKPVIMTHEIGHQLGFAKENEANFMAVLATINSPNPYYNYAGYAFALQYCLSDLAKNNPDKAKELIAKLHPGVRQNFRASRKFWNAHKNPIEPVFKQFYGNYLKINNQPDGMKSYSYVVALLVNYFQGENMI